MEPKNALVGFSINAEIIPEYDGRTPLEKALLLSIKAFIGGTSANVALAIQTFNQKSKLLALRGEGDDFENHILEYVLRNCKIPHKDFQILNTSHIALIPNDGIQTRIFGLKGKILPNKLDQTISEIEKETGQWRIATGVRIEEVKLVVSLFNKHAGFRSLNPRMELIKNKPVFNELLKNTDLLILNMNEYRECKVTSPSELHKYGPSLVIVTDSENGGMFSHKTTGAEIFPACLDYIKNGERLFTTGAGDWFHGAFISRCMEIGKSFNELTFTEIVDFINFAARVAGKVTMEGASSGPTKNDL